MNKTLSKAVLTIVLSLASLSATAEYTFTLLGRQFGSENYATSINNLGQIVGFSVAISGDTRAIVWNAGLPTGLHPQGGLAWSINNLGQIVGESRTGITSGYNYATIWNDEVATQLTNPREFVYTVANSINNSGQIVGRYYGGNSNSSATLWDNGVVIDLHPQGSFSSGAYSINDSGQIVGLAYNNVLLGSRSILWNNGVATDITPQGSLSSGAYSINNLGQIVGNVRNADDIYRATLWDNGVAIDLNSFLSASSISEGWVLDTALDINDNGSIVGKASNSFLGITAQAFVLTPVPEADTSAMLLTGLGVVGLMVRRRKNTQA